MNASSDLQTMRLQNLIKFFLPFWSRHHWINFFWWKRLKVSFSFAVLQGNWQKSPPPPERLPTSKVCFSNRNCFYLVLSSLFLCCKNFATNILLQKLSLWNCVVKHFVNLKSNSALSYNKGHNLLTSAFPQKLFKLIKFLLKSWIFPY